MKKNRMTCIASTIFMWIVIYTCQIYSANAQDAINPQTGEFIPELAREDLLILRLANFIPELAREDLLILRLDKFIPELGEISIQILVCQSSEDSECIVCA
jgi:hypothetical protein